MLDRRTLLLASPLAAAGLLRSGLGLAATGRERSVTSAEELAQALHEAKQSDQIVLDAGDYAVDGLVVAPAGPVTIKAREPLTARLSGKLVLRGADINLLGVEFNGGQVVVAGDRAQINRCRFVDNEGIALTLKNGRDIAVEHCAFEGCRDRGISIDPAGKAGTVAAPQIRYNLFRDFVGKRRDNGHEAVQLGQFGNHAQRRLGALLERNLFLNVGIDSETISVKSSDNVIRENTFLDCRSRPTNRFGNNNLWEANWIENCLGLWIYGANHRLLGNRVFGGKDEGIAIMAGNTSPDVIAMGKGARRNGDRRRRQRCESRNRAEIRLQARAHFGP
jgi:poly(beta-D-mannuronate) lyase